MMLVTLDGKETRCLLFSLGALVQNGYEESAQGLSLIRGLLNPNPSSGGRASGLVERARKADNAEMVHLYRDPKAL